MAHNQRGDNEDRVLRPRRNFSVRLPDELYAALETMSETTGESMNKLIGTAVAQLVDNPDLAPSAVASDINPTIARDAVRQGAEAIAPLKGIAKHASNRDQMVLACVLWAAAARIIATTDGAGAAAAELGHTADVAEKSGRVELAVALWEETLRLDPNNLEAANRLGQQLHHLAQKHGDDLERYREAERHLARVTFIDNRAKLFHGWSALHVARADNDRVAQDRAVAEIDEALKHWAFSQRSGLERSKWLRQIASLRAAGLDTQANSLIEFANHNARWEPIPEDALPGD